MCGARPGDPDPYRPGRTVRLMMSHITDNSTGGTDDRSNLRAICANCNEGLSNIAPQKPSRIALLSSIRRAAIDDQKAVFEWLTKKFGKLPVGVV